MRKKISRPLPPSVERGSWSVDEFAQRHGTGPSFMYGQIARHLLEAVKLGGDGPLRITPQAERDWLRRKPAARKTAEQRESAAAEA